MYEVLFLGTFIGLMCLAAGFITPNLLRSALPGHSVTDRFLMGAIAIGVLGILMWLIGRDAAWTNVCTCIALAGFGLRSAMLWIMGTSPPLVAEQAPEAASPAQPQRRQMRV